MSIASDTPSPTRPVVVLTRATAADIPELERDAAHFAAIAQLSARQQKNARASELLRRRRIEALRPKAPAPEPAPVPSPAPAPRWIKVADVPEVAPDFDVSRFVQKGGPAVPVQGDDQAAFRLHQGAVEISYVDPCFGVEPGSHPHLWINRGDVPPSGDYTAIRTSGDPVGEGRAINRTVYGCAPLMVQDLDDRWHPLIPVGGAIIYYKQEAPGHRFWRDNPHLTRASIPRGLRMLGGVKHYPRERWSALRDHDRNAPCMYNVLDGTLANPREISPKTVRLNELLPLCQPGRHIGMHITFPNLWDGEHADSPDHVSHVAYQPLEPWHRPARLAEIAHMRHVIPTVSYHLNHTLPDFPIKRLVVSSDLEHDVEPGATGHGYFLDGWVEEFRTKMFDVTFARNLNHSNGDYGDGVQLLGRDDSRWPRVKSLPFDPAVRRVVLSS